MPREIGVSVLSDVAARLGIRFPRSSLMTLDAVFVDQSAPDWFPVVVAIEHENVRTTFETEVRKLLSIQCPLKVGITYVPSSKPRAGLEKVKQAISRNCDPISQIVGEDEEAKYFFLVGVEPRVSLWYALDLRASDNPDSKTFEAIEIPSQGQQLPTPAE